jgi:hypothetical protein
MAESRREEPTDSARFAYFMVRVRIESPSDARSVDGMVERLGTGRKRDFRSGPDLLRLITDWSQLPSNMSPADQRRNVDASAPQAIAFPGSTSTADQEE